MTFLYGSGLTDPDRILLFSSVTKNFFSNLFAFYFLKIHLHYSSKIKSHKKSFLKEELRFFLLYLLDLRRVQIRIHTSDCWIWIRMEEAQKLRIQIQNTAYPYVCTFSCKNTFMRLWKHGQSYLDPSYALIASYATCQ
jgi:hypothetical protein